MKKISYFKYLVPIFVFLIFLYKSFKSLDPDFGWHLRMGEIILKRGVPEFDPFSYTMASFHFVDHEWFTNIFIYLGYTYINYFGLAIIFSLIAILVVLIPIKFKITNINFAPFLMASASILVFVGIRPQMITLLFLSILITILFENKFNKFKLFLPFLFLIWANLHAGFAIGIFTLFIYVFIKAWTERKIVLIDWLILLSSILVTLINPYGIRLWGEVYMQMSDSSLRWAVSEWQPSVFIYYPILWIFIAFSTFLIIKFHKSFNLFEKIIFFLILAAGISSVRHMSLWAVVALPLSVKGVITLKELASKYKYGNERFLKFNNFFIVLVVFVIMVPFFVKPKFLTEFNENESYPKSEHFLVDIIWGFFLALISLLLAKKLAIKI